MSLPNQRLLSEEGIQALKLAASLSDPVSLASANTLRKHFDPDLAAAASAQIALRRRAREKFGATAEHLFLTPDGLEQASRPQVARWRAERLVASGITRVIDLGCGIGADALAFAEAGMQVSAVEANPVTAAFAEANLAWQAAALPAGPAAEVFCGDATVLGPDLLATAAEGTVVFLDPARRDARGRSWRPADFSPSWDFVRAMLEYPACVKLGPGLPRELIPDRVEACWVTHRSDTVEAGLWTTADACRGQSRAVVLRDGLPAAGLVVPADCPGLPVRAPGRYLIEPVGALIRARGLAEIAPDAWLLDAQAAYLSADHPVNSPFASCFEVLEVLDYRLKSLRAWVRANDIGILEIKKRAIDIDPAQLRRQLKPAGANEASLIIARTIDAAKVFVVRRTGSQPDTAGTRVV